MSSCSQLNIGVVAYGITPQKVMVRVPNERGRWLLADWCVIAVPCDVCGAITGEPCFNQLKGVAPDMRTYWTTTHYRRRNAASAKYGRSGWKHFQPHKIRLREEDLACDTGDGEANP